MITIPTSTTASVLSSVSSLFADPGFLGVVVLAVALPLAFWAIRQLISLFPKSRAKTS